MTPAATFVCSICGEPSVSICVYCTKDACPNHICERCARCSDCCECDIRLEEPHEHAPEHIQQPAEPWQETSTEPPASEPPVETAGDHPAEEPAPADAPGNEGRESDGPLMAEQWIQPDPGESATPAEPETHEPKPEPAPGE